MFSKYQLMIYEIINDIFLFLIAKFIFKLKYLQRSEIVKKII